MACLPIPPLRHSLGTMNIKRRTMNGVLSFLFIVHRPSFIVLNWLHHRNPKTIHSTSLAQAEEPEVELAPGMVLSGPIGQVSPLSPKKPVLLKKRSE